MSQVFRLFDASFDRFTTEIDVPRGSESGKILLRVLRKLEGESLEVLNGRGLIGKAHIAKIEKDKLVLAIGAIEEQKRLRRLGLLQASLKKDKNEIVVQKATELGISQIMMVNTTHSIKKMNQKDLARYQKIAIEALRQSGNAYLPEISLCDGLEENLNQLNQNPNLRKFVLGQSAPVQHLSEIKSDTREIIFAVGPEGDFSAQEIQDFASHDFKPLSIHPHTLRSETAAIAIIAFASIFSHIH